MTFPAILNVSDLNGSNGFKIPSLGESARPIGSVSGLGDINGDGIDDIFLGVSSLSSVAVDAAPTGFIIFGSTDGYGAEFDLSDLNGSNGFTISGEAQFEANTVSVSSAGDVNGDGISDILYTAASSAPDSESVKETYIIFGSNGGFATNFDLSSLDGTNGFRIDGGESFSLNSSTVSAAGDVNADGVDDLIVGNFQAGDAGEAQIIFGRSDGYGASYDVTSLDGTNGFKVSGSIASDRFGSAVSGVGDVNGDGIDDVIIGAPLASPDGLPLQGETYVVFGATGGFGAELNASALDGSNGFLITGADFLARIGTSVSGAGDINNDGIDDLIIGGPMAGGGRRQPGESYIIFGTENNFSAAFDLGTLDGTNGFTVAGASGEVGTGATVSSTGDVNGDGIDDVIIGSNGVFAGPASAGPEDGALVVFGSEDGFDALLDAATLDGTNGFQIDGIDFNATGIGDINGDGANDVMVIGRDINSSRDSSAYIIFGEPGEILTEVITTDDNNEFSWSSRTEVFDSNGTIVSRNQIFDDGRVQDIQYSNGVRAQMTVVDEQDTFAWNSRVDTFDENGVRTLRQQDFDDGRVLETIYSGGVRSQTTIVDQDNAFAWSNRVDTFDENGVRTLRQQDYDDGRMLETIYSEGVKSQTTIIDQDNAYAWISRIDTFDENGVRTFREQDFDDGRLLELSYVDGVRSSSVMTDVDDQYPWVTRTDTFDENGVRISREFTFDVDFFA